MVTHSLTVLIVDEKARALFDNAGGIGSFIIALVSVFDLASQVC